MEATKQADRTVKAWTDAQIKVWETWMDTIQGSTTGKSGVWDQVRKATIDSLEKSVAKTLDAQAELSHVLAQSLGSIWSTTEDAGDRLPLAEIEAITKSAAEAQKQLWTSWFDVAKKVDVVQLANGWQKVVEAWQQAVQKAMETQAKWFDLTQSGAPSSPSRASSRSS